MARTVAKQIKLPHPAAERVKQLAADLQAPQATLLRLMVVRCLTDEKWLDQQRDRFLGLPLPFEGPSKPKGRTKR